MTSTPGDVRTACNSSLEGFLIPVGVVFLTIVTVAVLNCKIAKIARDQRRKIAENCVPNGVDNLPPRSHDYLLRFKIKRELKHMKTFVIVMGAILVCLTPLNLAALVTEYICNGCLSHFVFLILADIGGLNSLLNPFIYGIRQKEYRNGYRRLFMALCNRTWFN